LSLRVPRCSGKFRVVDAELVLPIRQKANVHAPGTRSSLVVLEARDLLFCGAQVSHCFEQRFPILKGLPVAQRGLGVDMQWVHGIAAIVPVRYEMNDDYVHEMTALISNVDGLELMILSILRNQDPSKN
jgi:hypothetical protein